MASLFRPKSVTWKFNGKTRLPDGRRVIRQTPGAVKEVSPSPVWWGKYKAADGSYSKVPLCGDKTASKQMLAKLVTDAKLTSVGMGDPFAEHRTRPLAEHLEDYRRHLEAKGNTGKHVRLTVRRVRAVLDGCRFVFLADLDAAAVAGFLHDLRRDPPRPELPAGQEWFRKRELVEFLGIHPGSLKTMLSRWQLTATGNGKARRYPRQTVEALAERYTTGNGVATSNHYLTAVKGFTRWLVKVGRAPADPLAILSRQNAQTDIRRERRNLEEGELRALLTAAESNPVAVKGLPGADRAMLYAVAMTTGFRAGELSSLGPGSFELNLTAPTVTVAAGYSKRRRRDTQPLPLDVANALRDYLAGKPAHAPLWPGIWHEKAADMLRVDLEAAGIPYLDEAGRVADFHALRHSYISLLTQRGVHPKLAQELARHSDIRLTMQAYTHVQLHDLAGAVQNLPFLLPSTNAAPLAATGTDGPAPRPCRDQTADARGERVRLPRPPATGTPQAAVSVSTDEASISRSQAVSDGLKRERPLPDSNRGMADLQSAERIPQRSAQQTLLTKCLSGLHKGLHRPARTSLWSARCPQARAIPTWPAY